MEREQANEYRFKHLHEAKLVRETQRERELTKEKRELYRNGDT